MYGSPSIFTVYFYRLVFMTVMQAAKKVEIYAQCATRTYHAALLTALRILLFVALDTDDILVARDETVADDRLAAFLAAEALFVPLLTFVFVFLHSCACTHAHSVRQTWYNMHSTTAQDGPFDFVRKCVCLMPSD